MDISQIYNAVSGLGVCGVSVNGDSVRLDFKPDATDEQRAAAQAIVDNWVDPTPPDWKAFRVALYADDGWKRVLNSSPVGGAVIASSLWQFQSDPTIGVEIKFLWDGLIEVLDPPLSPDEVDSLNTIAGGASVPIVVGNDGTIEFSV